MGAFGTGDSDNSSGSASISTDGDIETSGINSTGILAQSIGGGGGFIGLHDSGEYRIGLGSSFSTGINESGSVNITNQSNVVTKGDNSAALVAQSIGGGGGSISVDLTDASSPISLLTLGSADADSTNSGLLEVASQSNLQTAGVGSPSLLLQSIGGGGGAVQTLSDSSATNIQLGVDVVLINSKSLASSGSINFTSNSNSLISTAGDFSAAAIIQSIGGGGGWALINSQVGTALGAGVLNDAHNSLDATVFNKTFYGVATGGPVTADVSGTIQTTGSTSPGFVVQTIGGGGGYAGNSDGFAQLGGYYRDSTIGISGSSNELMPIACQFGSCSEGTVDQAVLVDIDGRLLTTGSTSPVMLVQAVGGGGGRLGTIGGNATLGIKSGTGLMQAEGGSVRVVSNAGASLSSIGNDSAALVVQSIGGGGGSVNSIGGNATLGANSTGNLSAGAITLNGPFTAQTKGTNSPGVVLQSIGGGGGLAADVDGDQIDFGTLGTANTSAADVTAISRKWQIGTEGRNSPGLILQSSPLVVAVVLPTRRLRRLTSAVQ